jgi:hypothetical protein
VGKLALVYEVTGKELRHSDTGTFFFYYPTSRTSHSLPLYSIPGIHYNILQISTVIMSINMKGTTLFSAFLLFNLLAAQINHIDDTDETYGYWEPLHYLVNGTGLQTWEYAPQYAIRTYAFIYPFYLISSFLKTSVQLDSTQCFFVMRSIIGLFTAYCESCFVSSVSKSFGTTTAGYVVMLILCAPGMLFCSTSFLPSAVCTSLLMLSCSAWLDEHFVSCIFWGCIAVLFTGWPFCGLLFLPMGLHMLYIEFFRGLTPQKSEPHQLAIGAALFNVFVLVLAGVSLVVAIQGTVMIIDHKYYDKW